MGSLRNISYQLTHKLTKDMTREAAHREHNIRAVDQLYQQRINTATQLQASILVGVVLLCTPMRLLYVNITS